MISRLKRIDWVVAVLLAAALFLWARIVLVLIGVSS